MGARLVVEFKDEMEGPNAMVYLHWGGEHSQDVRATMDEFMSAIESLSNQRLDDASYLAAKMIVWAANDLSLPAGSLDFSGVGVVTDAGWGDAHVVVDCTKDGKWWIEKAIDYA